MLQSRFNFAAALAAASVLSAPAAARAQAADSAPAAAVQAVRADGRIQVDGDLSDAVWASAPVASGFVQQRPDAGAPASARSEARVAYDADAVYVALRLYDARPDSITAPLARRDEAAAHSDWAYVLLDSYDDNRTAFAFGVNPRGVKADHFVFNDAQTDRSWDAVWDAAARIDSLGWTAEFRIPLSQLRFNPARLSWGINFQRRIARRDEISFWAPVSPDEPRLVSRSGRLTGLAGLRAPRRLELQPYMLGRATRAPGERADPFFRETDVFGSAGMDVKYGLGADLTLTAAVNPDFGQVEADPSVVNLTAFESFFEERRPLFTEGSDIFQLGLGLVTLPRNEQLVYSRRIGRAPQRQVFGESFVDAPGATTILGAAKLSGKVGGGWSVGLLDAVTAPEETRAFGDGRDTVYAAEPLTNYLVGRASRSSRSGQSTVGGIVTAVHRDLPDGAGLDFLHSAAYAGGVDGSHRFGGGRYEVSGSLLASRVEGSPRALLRTQTAPARYLQRPGRGGCGLCLELDSARTSLDGAAAALQLSRISGGHWRGRIIAGARTPGFEVNDLGYQQIADAAGVLGGVDYVQNRPGPLFRSWMAGVGGGSGWTLAGERTFGVLDVNASFQLQNLWSGYAGVRRLPAVLSPTVLRGGPALRGDAATSLLLALAGDPRGWGTWGVTATYLAEDGTGGYAWTLRPAFRMRPSGATEVSLEPLAARNAASWQYVATSGTGAEARYVGGRLDQTTVALTGRLRHAFTPELTLQLYAQPFVSAGRFSDYRRVASPGAASFRERFAPVDPLTADFNVQEFRSTAVLRWEYRPGSTVFVVWNQARGQVLGDGRFSAGRDFGRLFGWEDDFAAPMTNVLLLKVSYWLDR